jgi:hypothetical protein
VNETRSQLVVSDVGDQLDGYAEQTQIKTGVRDATAGADCQRSDCDDCAGQDLLVASQLGT